MPELSQGSLLVLRELKAAEGKEVIKLALKELVARGALEAARVAPTGLRLLRRDRMLLVPTGRTVAGDDLLAWAQRQVAASPSTTHQGRVAHDVADLAKAMAKADPKVARRLVEQVLGELEALGLVAGARDKALGLIPRTRWTRTPAGDAELGAARPRRPRRTSGDTGTGTGDGGWTGAEPAHHGHGALDPALDGGLDSSLDPGLDAGLDSSLDASFDSSFDASFDSAFDGSFDSGFSDGGGGDGVGGGDAGGSG